jgi:hypothetical protein
MKSPAFPKRLSPEQHTAALAKLKQSGPVCQHAAEYLSSHNVALGYAKQSSGARWTTAGAIELSPVSHPPTPEPLSPHALGCIVHEALHLEQGTAMALSVEGEVGGWRAEFDARVEMGDPITDPHWAAVARTPVPPTDRDLRTALDHMVAMAGRGYLVWMLPLRPNLITRAAASISRRR